MQRSRTQRSLADQYLDKYFTPGKYSRNKTVQQKSTDKLTKEQKDIQKHQNRSELENKQISPNRHSQSDNVKIEDSVDPIRSGHGQVKTMELSQQCKKILMKMQRFDRYLYPILSEKEFRQPIDAQIKRLERVKNQKKQMWKKTYDTQLLINALFNNIKLVIQMNRQLQDRQSFKNQVKQLQKKIYQLKNDHKKQLKKAGKAAPDENLDLSKADIIIVKKIISLLQQENSQEAQIELKKFVGEFQKVHADLGRLCELFRNYIYDYKTHSAFLKQSSIKKLITNIDSISQCLTLNKIEDLKKTFQKLEQQEIRDHAQEKILVLLRSIIVRLDDSEGKLEKRETKSEAASKLDKKQIQKITRTDSSKNKEYQKQINRLKGQLERANREQKRLQTITKEKNTNKKQTVAQEDKNTRDQTIITLQNDIKMLKKDLARLEQDNRTKTLKIHNLTKHGKDLEVKLSMSQPKSKQESTPQKIPQKSLDRSIKSQKIQGDQDKQIIDRIVKELNNKQEREKLLIELKKKGIKNRYYILLDSIIKLQKNMEGKTTKIEQSDEITKNHLTSLLNLMESQSDQHWWTNRNPIPNPNNFKNGIHSALINRLLQKVKEVYKIWSVTQNQNSTFKRDIQEYKGQVEILKIVKQESLQIKTALKAAEKKFPKLKEDAWEKPNMLKDLIQQQFNKKQLRQLLSVRQDFQSFITFVVEQLRNTTVGIQSSRQIKSSRSIKSLSPIKPPQDDSIHKTNLESINAFSNKATKLINKGENWQKELTEIRKSMPKMHFINFVQALLKSQRVFQLRIQKLQQSENSAKEHLNMVIDLLESEQNWWKNKNPVALNYKDRTLSTYIYKITDHIKSIYLDIESKSRISQKQPIKASESEQDLKASINYVTQIIKNILKKIPKLKNQICSDQKYLINLLKSDLAAGKRQMKQLNPLLSEMNSLLLEAANIYVSNHNTIIDKVEEKTNQLEKDLKDHIKQIRELQQSLAIKNSRLKKSEQSKQLQNATFNGEIAKLKNTIQNLLKQEKSTIDRTQSEQKNKTQIQKKFDQISEQNKNLSQNNERIKREVEKLQADLAALKQKEKDIKNTERENQKIKNQLQTVREELESMKQKVKQFSKSKGSLENSKHDKQIQYQNSIAELEMLNKITQEKLDYAEKKKTQLAKQITKKNEQIQFEVDARKKDKSFYDKMKSKLENQITELSDQLQAQRRQSNKTISELTLQKNQLKKDLEIQQANSKDKITQLYLQLQKSSTVDRGILDIKRQFQKVKTQLSQSQKNHQIETQQLRKYIAKMNADMQTLIITKDQEKRVLREQIQLIRQEQTNQYFKKTKKMQQQNRNLKEEQSRLIYIVESNQSNFNALVEENRILYDQIEDLKRQMVEPNSTSRLNESNQKIMALEDKLRMFQALMEGKSDSQEYQKALRTIEQISRDNRDLKDQLRSLERRERQSQQLSLSRSNEHSQAFMETFAKYERTLTENSEIKSNLSIAHRQLRQLQLQNDKLTRNNENLTRKVEQKIQQVYNLQRVKNQYDFKVKQSEKILIFTQSNLRRQIQELSERVKYGYRQNQQENLTSQKQKELQNLKQSQHSLRVLLEEKNLRIQNLMSENYSVRLSLNQKQKVIETNDALSKIQRQRVSSENLSIAHRQLRQLQSQNDKLTRNNENLTRKVEQKIQQVYNLQRVKNQYDFKVKQSEKILIFTQSNLRRQIQELSERVKYGYRQNQQENLTSQKQKELQNLKQSQHSLRVLLEEKNLRIQNLMSENYSVRLSLNQKQKIIETNDALSKIQRQRVSSENQSLIKVNTRLQEQFAKRENQYRQEIDRVRHDCIKYEEELRSHKQNYRRVQFELEQSRKMQHNTRDQSHSQSTSTIRGYQQNFHKLITDNNEFRSQVGILQLSLKHKDQQIDQLKQKLNEFKNRLNEKVKEVQQKTRANGELNNQIRDVNRQTEMKVRMIQFEKKNLQSSVEDLHREKRSLSTQIEELRIVVGQKIQSDNEVQKLRKALFESENRFSTISVRIQALQIQNSKLMIEKQRHSSDYSNPERELDRMMEQINSLRRQQNNLRHSLDRKQEQLKSVRNQMIELQFRSKQATQKIKFQKMSIEQQLSLLKNKFDTLNNKHSRQKQQITLKQSESQRRIHQYQTSNDSQLYHTKKLFEQEKRQTARLRDEMQKLKNKNTQLLNLNKQIKEINQETIRKLHRSINQKHQLEFYSKANQQLIQKVNQKNHQLKEENHKLRNGAYINGSIAQRAQSSYQGLLIKIRELQSRLLHEQDAIYKLQHENRRINNEKIMLDLEVKRISRDLQMKNQDILELRQNTANSMKEKYSLSQKVEDFQQNSRQQNTYLKTIMSMLNGDGYSAQKDDLSQIQILLRISMEVEQLIKSHRRLQNNNKQLLQQRDRLKYGGSMTTSNLASDLAVFGKQLVDCLFEFLFERGIFTSEDIIKMKKRRQSVHFLSHQNSADYFQQLEEVIKDILDSMIDTQRRHIQVHRNVLKDVNYLLADYLKSGNNQYLLTIKRSLESSLEF